MMLPSAALILTDALGAQFARAEPAERAALAAREAGIHHVFFCGRGAPDLALHSRLRAQGVFGNTAPAWPRLFAGLPAACVTLVLDARTVIEPRALRALWHDTAATPHQASLMVEAGPPRKNSVLHVADGRIHSVVGGGNASSIGIAAIPDALIGRIRGVCSMQDAIHRLAKTGDLRAVDAGPVFHRIMTTPDDLPAIDAAYRRHVAGAAGRELINRLRRMPKVLRGILVAARHELLASG